MSQSQTRPDVSTDALKPTVFARTVGKTYRVDTERTLLKRRCKPSQTDGQVRSLTGVSFLSEAGDSIGVLGQNGSGKSTLMRLIAGSELPSFGTIQVKSQPVILGISAALHPHLTGEQNIRLGCLAMGMSPEEVEASFQSIVDLAGIGDAIYRPMKTYSAGMGSRLKFAIATSINPEILLIDEALSAGDAAFSARAESKMNELLSAAGTAFIVSHSAATIKSLCNRAIWLHLGRVIADGDVTSIADNYRKWAVAFGNKDLEKAQEIINSTEKDYRQPNYILTTSTSRH